MSANPVVADAFRIGFAAGVIAARIDTTGCIRREKLEARPSGVATAAQIDPAGTRYVDFNPFRRGFPSLACACPEIIQQARAFRPAEMIAGPVVELCHTENMRSGKRIVLIEVLLPAVATVNIH